NSDINLTLGLNSQPNRLPSPSFFQRCRAPPDLHSFPTRRSSDLSADRNVRHGSAAHLIQDHYAFQLGSFGGRSDEASKLKGVVVDRKSTRLNSSHLVISYAVFCLKKKILKLCEHIDYSVIREHGI